MAGSIGPNVFVTGASRGIGLGLVQNLVNRPDVKRIFAGARAPSTATVILNCPKKLTIVGVQELQDLAKQNSKIHVVQFDSLDDNSIKQAVSEVEKVVGSEGLNLLINNAGVFMSVSPVRLFPNRGGVSGRQQQSESGP